MYYEYIPNGTGMLTNRSYIDSDGTTLRETLATQVDSAGRVVTETLGTAVTTYTYDNTGGTGRLLSVTDADGVATAYGYNSKGERIATALDVNHNDAVDLATDEQITVTETTFQNAAPPTGGGAIDLITTTTQVYPHPTTGGSASSPVTVSTTYRTPDGLRSWTVTPAYSTASSAVVDAVTSSETALSGSGNWTEITTRPDGTRTVSTYTGGLLASVAQRDAAASPGPGNLISSTTYGYDGLNRQETITDSRTGTVGDTVLAYDAGNISDAVVSVTDPGGRTTSYTYDHRGRRLTTTLPDTTVTHTSYYPGGQVKASWGSQTYPTYTTYDYADRIKTLRTNPTLDGSGVPTAGTGSVTTWNYSGTTGWLTSKEDHLGNGPTYSHTNAGRLASRTWKRGKHTVYEYVNGRQVAVKYYTSNTLTTPDPDTSDVGIVYTRMGQPQRMVTASRGSIPGTSIAYTFGAPGLNITQETTKIDPDLTFSVGGSGVSVTEGATAAFIERVLDRKTDDYMRSLGADLFESGPALVVGQELSYHTSSGRLESIYATMNSIAWGFQYTYENNAYGLIEAMDGGIDSGIPTYTVTNTWEGTRDVLDKKENKVGSTNISTYDYSVNSIGQRTAVATSGTAFATQADWNWGYNGFGEIESAQHVNTGASSRHYSFDAIGNRTQHREGGHTVSTGTPTNYYADTTGTPVPGANALNQYERITLPSSTNVDPTYDTDGNMTSGPIPNDPTVLATFTWDGENRLFSVTPNGGDTTSYVRDAMGRRVMKSITVSGTTTKTYFFYDGWNLIAEYSHITGTPVLKRTHVWGTDLSGSLQGAGGVGGLLATYLHNAGGDSGVYYPTYDGNGNVTEYLDGSGAVKVHLEYDPFGNPLVNTDTGNLFPIRFSTKYLDFESGMIHYGGRDYESFTGRWPSRDPIEERGGLNLYGFIKNRPLNSIDYLGFLKAADIGHRTKYSCKCGWIDTEHVKAGIDEWRMLDAGIKRYEAFGSSTIGTFRHRGVNADYGLIYNPLVDPKIGQSRISMAWGIAFDFEYNTEEWQYQFSAFDNTGFAVEDIPSVFIGFLQEAGVLSETDCKPLGKEDSIRMYLYGTGPSINKSYKPLLWTYVGSRIVSSSGGMGEAGYAPPPILSREYDSGCDPCAKKDKTIPKAFDDYKPKGKNHDWFRIR